MNVIHLWRVYAGRKYDLLRRVRPYHDMLADVVDAAKIRGEDTVFDGGGGTGILAWTLRQRLVRLPIIFVAENSPVMLKRARAINRYPEDLIRFSSFDLNGKSSEWMHLGKFSRFVFNNSIYTLTDPATTIRNASLIAAPNARIVISTPKPGAIPEVILDEHLRQSYPRWLRGVAGTYWRRRLKQLTKINREIIASSTFHFPDEAKIYSWFEGTSWGRPQISTTYVGQNWLIVADLVSREPGNYDPDRLDFGIATSRAERRLVYWNRHELLCLGKCGEVLITCDLADASGPHDLFDQTGTVLFWAKYGGVVIASSRLILGGDFSMLPTGKLLPRLEDPPPTKSPKRYSEPSKVTLLEEFQLTRISLNIQLRLIGMMCETSVEHGFDYFIMTLRVPMIRNIPWFPWVLSEPIDYPEDDGGTKKFEAMFPGTVLIYDVVEEILARSKAEYDMMFPAGTEWHRPKLAHTSDERATIRNVSLELFQNARQRWREGQKQLSPLAPAS